MQAFTPNAVVSRRTLRGLFAFHAGLALAVWCASPFAVLPRPAEVARALASLWLEQGLGRELLASFAVNLEALAWTLALGLPLAWLSVVPFLRPLTAAASQARFLGMAGLTLVLTLMLGGGRPLKVALLVFGMGVFFVTSLAEIVAATPRDSFDHARTLRMGEWRVVWEVVVLGSADKALDALRQNAAIGWMMLPMVEGLVRSEGGVGALLLAEGKHFRLAEVFAIQLLILGVGILQDAALGAARRWLFPYAGLALERGDR